MQNNNNFRYIIVDAEPPYKISVWTKQSYQPPRIKEIYIAMRTLQHQGHFGTLRMLAICVKKSIMRCLRPSQQQLTTETFHTPEDLSMFEHWAKALADGQPTKLKV